MTILDQIDRVTSGLCPCGAQPADGSAYCSDDCRPTHISRDTDQREAGHHLATPMRWRPDLVTATDDSDLIHLGTETLGYRGRFHAQIFERRTNPEVWHLRLDDGHRYVGCDLDGVGGRQDPITEEVVGQARDAWRRLERELVNPLHTEPVNGDPWADVGWGMADTGQTWDIEAGTSTDFRVDNTPIRFDIPVIAPQPISPPLPGHLFGIPIVIDDTVPAGQAAFDRIGETLVLRARDNSFTLTEEMQERIRDHYTECARRATEAMTRFAEAFRPALQQIGETMSALAGDLGLIDPPGENWMERALRARRTRNTGPAPDRLDGRRRRR